MGLLVADNPVSFMSLLSRCFSARDLQKHCREWKHTCYGPEQVDLWSEWRPRPSSPGRRQRNCQTQFEVPEPVSLSPNRVPQGYWSCPCLQCNLLHDIQLRPSIALDIVCEDLPSQPNPSWPLLPSLWYRLRHRLIWDRQDHRPGLPKNGKRNRAFYQQNCRG
jgi:hypothetical protein